MILKDRKFLVTGVVTKTSIAFHIARTIQQHGGEVILTGGPGKSCRLTEKAASFLDPAPPVVQMDVTNEEHINNVVEFVKEKWGAFDGLLHSVAYAPANCLGTDFAEVPWDDVKVAFQISAYSLARLGSAFSPLMKGGSIVALDFDASMVWANYNWMGVCKAGLESISRYLAMDLGQRYGVRVNCIASGPLKTVAAKAIPAFAQFDPLWKERAVLGWNPDKDGASVADTAVFLFSDMSAKTTGSVIHCDGGFNIMGTPLPAKVEAATAKS